MSTPRVLAPRISPGSLTRRQSEDGSEPKRRKIRKGTHSCWECKRRKMKCIFNNDDDATCEGCQQRSSKCVSQDLPDEQSSKGAGRSQKMGERVERVEGILEELLKRMDREKDAESRRSARSSDMGTKTPTGIPTPASLESESSCIPIVTEISELSVNKATPTRTVEQGFPLRNGSSTAHRLGQLSQTLYSCLPPKHDIERICATKNGHCALYYALITKTYEDIERKGLDSPDHLLRIPGSNSHPVLVARYMLYLACFLQQLEGADEELDLSEPPLQIIQRLTDAASQYVTSNDDLLGSIEGLQCILIEAVYQSNLGNLRRAWVGVKRAIVIAQLIGLQRNDNHPQFTVLDPREKPNAEVLWFRVLFFERQLCLLLGLPSSSSDRGMASEPKLAIDTPIGKLERIHCVLASRILERNELTDHCAHAEATQKLDWELQSAANTMPSRWWGIPTLGLAHKDPEQTFWDARRLASQLLHFNLINQLHLPYMLCSQLPTGAKFEYSKMACVNASREMLSRFIALRSFNKIAVSCRSIDFLALMAAMTLLLVHLESRRAARANDLLAHQYLSDRAMIEEAYENMKEMGQLRGGDPLSLQSSRLVRRMLDIEESGCPVTPSEHVSVQCLKEADEQPEHEEKDGVVRVRIPYFGIIKIARQEGISLEPHSHLAPYTNPSYTALPRNDPTAQSIMQSNDSVHGYHAFGQTLPAQHGDAAANVVPFNPQFGDDFYPQQMEFPGLGAEANDWAFQGVDLAFFDSLMRNAD